MMGHVGIEIKMLLYGFKQQLLELIKGKQNARKLLVWLNSRQGQIMNGLGRASIAWMELKKILQDSSPRGKSMIESFYRRK